jgi:hypothetical protein
MAEESAERKVVMADPRMVALQRLKGEASDNPFEDVGGQMQGTKKYLGDVEESQLSDTGLAASVSDKLRDLGGGAYEYLMDLINKKVQTQGDAPVSEDAGSMMRWYGSGQNPFENVKRRIEQERKYREDLAKSYPPIDPNPYDTID